MRKKHCPPGRNVRASQKFSRCWVCLVTLNSIEHSGAFPCRGVCAVGQQRSMWLFSGLGYYCLLVTQLWPHVCVHGPMDCSPPGSSVRGILQARTLEWGTISFSRGSSPPRMEPASSALQTGFLPTAPPGKLSPCP